MIVRSNEVYSFNLDWLQWSVELRQADFQFNTDTAWRVEVLPGTNIFRKRAIVYVLNGEKYLTLCWSPYSKLLSDKLMTVQLANPFLYGYDISDTQKVLETLVPCDFVNIGRMDICCDFDCDEYKRHVIDGLFTGRYYVERKKEGATFWHQVTTPKGVVRFPHCLSWGQKSSDIKFKLYNKSREQGLPQGEPEKPYIVDEWREAGFNINNVWRFEVSITGVGCLTWMNKRITLDVLANPNMYRGIFVDMYERRWKLRDRLQWSHDDAGQRIPFLDLSNLGGHADWLPVKDARKSNEARVVARKLLDMLQSPLAAASDKVLNNLFGTLSDIVNRYYLHGWLQEQMNGEDLDELYCRLSDECGAGVFERNPRLGQSNP